VQKCKNIGCPGSRVTAEELTGKVRLTQYDAGCSINSDPARHTLDARRGR
jgi:hypothetical protein